MHGPAVDTTKLGTDHEHIPGISGVNGKRITSLGGVDYKAYRCKQLRRRTISSVQPILEVMSYKLPDVVVSFCLQSIHISPSLVSARHTNETPAG